MKCRLLFSLLLLFLFSPMGFAEEAAPQVAVIDPYLDMHSGPGRGYPIIRVVKEGEWVSIHKRKNRWFFISTRHGETGWVARDQLERTLNPQGEQTTVKAPNWKDFSQRSWELAMMAGDLDGSRAMGISALYFMTPNLGLEANYGIGLGTFFTSEVAGLAIQHQPFPRWRVAPYLSLGGGVMQIKPKATLVKSERRQEGYASATMGLRTYLSQRFVLRLQYKEYVLFNSDENNEEIIEWKIGFAVFF